MPERIRTDSDDIFFDSIGWALRRPRRRLIEELHDRHGFNDYVAAAIGGPGSRSGRKSAADFDNLAADALVSRPPR